MSHKKGFMFEYAPEDITDRHNGIKRYKVQRYGQTEEGRLVSLSVHFVYAKSFTEACKKEELEIEKLL